MLQLGYLQTTIQLKKTNQKNTLSHPSCWKGGAYVFEASFTYLTARLMLSGLGGGRIKHTDGITISNPPGPVTAHLLR